MAVEVFGVAICLGIIVHAIAKLVAQGWRVGMVVIAGTGLMSIRGIKGHAFVDEGVAIPDAIAVDSVGVGGFVLTGRGVVGKGIATVEHCDPIDKKPDAS